MGSTAGSAVTPISTAFGATLWLATHLRAAPRVVSSHLRNKQDVYWKGISETVKLSTTTSDPFKWRRIVFQLEGGPNATGLAENAYRLEKPDFDLEAPLAGDTAFPTNPYPLDYTYRNRRAAIPLSTTDFGTLASGLFQGQSGIDYSDYLTAKVDNRIKVMSDKIRTISSQNDAGVLRTYKLYTPINKTMRYADAESGTIDAPNGYAAMNSPMNDVYIMDYFEQLPDAPNTLALLIQATQYWHER